MLVSNAQPHSDGLAGGVRHSAGSTWARVAGVADSLTAVAG
jgi:hypothetical protein